MLRQRALRRAPQNFQELYESMVAPRLAMIDISMKTRQFALTPLETSAMLMISESEVNRLMQERGSDIIDRATFFSIMKAGSSWLCGLYKRECEIGSPYVYTSDDVAYIYGIEEPVVREAFAKAGVSEATQYTLPLVFRQIET